jgi:hypothetical protein
VAEAETVVRWAPDLVDGVKAGGRLADAYEAARARKAQAEQDLRDLDRLEVEHPTLAAQVNAGTLTLAEARAMAAAQARAQAEAAEVERLRLQIALTREEIGEAVPLPPMRDLTPAFTPDARGEIVAPEFARNTDAEHQALQREQDFLRRLVDVKRQVQALAGTPVLQEVSWREGHLNAVRAAAAAMVTAAYEMVDAHEAQLATRASLREVK